MSDWILNNNYQFQVIVITCLMPLETNMSKGKVRL